MGRGGFWAYLRDVCLSSSSPMAISIWAITTFLTTLTGPFGTFVAFEWPIRLLFWGGLIAASIFVGFIVRFAFARKVWDRVDWLWEATTSLVFTGVFVPIVWLTALLFTGNAEELPPVTLIAASVISVFWTVALLRHHLGYEDAPQPNVPRIAARLEGEMTAPIARLSVEDHYVHVFMMDGGHEKVLMRLKDAVDEVATLDGFCVHRSHWVARYAITDVRRENGREFVRLACGTDVPVGRKYRPNLERAGLLD